jgi:hypothetical protein
MPLDQAAIVVELVEKALVPGILLTYTASFVELAIFIQYLDS